MRGLYDNINPNNNNFTTYFFYTVDDGNEIENNYNGYSNDKNKGSNTNNTNKENQTGNASSSSCTHYSILSWIVIPCTYTCKIVYYFIKYKIVNILSS